MGMLITLAINHQPIDSIEVVNRGPVDGVYAEGDGPGGDGERVYEFVGRDGSGFVHHTRGDGALALASKVLAEIRRATTYPHQGSET